MRKLLSIARATHLALSAIPLAPPAFPVSAEELERKLLVLLDGEEFPYFKIDRNRKYDHAVK